MSPNTSGRAALRRAFQRSGTPAPTAPTASIPERASGVRLALLAAILYNPLILIGYLLYLYGPSQHCVAGPLCKFGDYPGFLQLIVLALGAWLLWLLLDVGVRWLLEAPGWQGRLTRGLRAVSNYESARELLGIMGVALMLAMVVALLSHRLTPTVLILGAFTAGVSIRAALLRDAPARVAQPEAAPAAQPAPEDAAPVMTFIPVAPYTPVYTPPVYTPSDTVPQQPYSGPVYTSPTPAPTYTPPASGPVYTSPPSASTAPAAPPLYTPPPEFLPPQQLVSPSDETRPSSWDGWEGQEL